MWIWKKRLELIEKRLESVENDRQALIKTLESHEIVEQLDTGFIVGGDRSPSHILGEMGMVKLELEQKIKEATTHRAFSIGQNFFSSLIPVVEEVPTIEVIDIILKHLNLAVRAIPEKEKSFEIVDNKPVKVKINRPKTKRKK